MEYIYGENITQGLLDEASQISGEYFQTEEDTRQIGEDDINLEFAQNGSEFLIVDNGQVIGNVFGFFVSLENANKFIDSKITEKELFYLSKEYLGHEVFYLCSAFIKPEFRKQGVIFNTIKEQLKFLFENKKIKPILLSWSFSEAGEKLSKKIANEFGLELRLKKK